MDFNILQIGFELGGPIIDIFSFEEDGIIHSLLCINISFSGIYLEIFGSVLIDTFEDEEV